MLSDNDKQRIEQAAKLSWKNTITAFEDSDEISFWEGYLTGAEYATLFERQQQDKWVKLTGELVEAERRDAYDAGLMCERILAKDQIERLEAERSEVVSLLKEFSNDTGAVDTNLKARVKMYLAEHKL